MAYLTGLADDPIHSQQMPRENAAFHTGQKSYVFVNEHNRHKRLKVMRACEGCRKRKIRCDAATTNSWPCAACLRLKLQCIPPSASSEETYLDTLDTPTYTPAAFALDANYNSTAFAGQINLHHGHAAGHQDSLPTPISATEPSYFYFSPDPHVTSHPQVSQAADPETADPLEIHTPEHLADMLGELKMSDLGTAKYLNRKSKTFATEDPVIHEAYDYKDILPPSPYGQKIRIPPQLMPDDETVMHYFALYFEHVHPYVPVLNRLSFYTQWHEDRESISPLILEAIFAIAGRLADEPAQGHQWLALASRHVDAFMDKPRLSTLQAMLIVLKARESAPKRGYYYRSWMTVKACVEMAKDLGLDEHYEDHKNGQSCGISLADCGTKTRIWQTLFVCEVMIGSPQGRTDLAVDPESVDMRIQKQYPGLNITDYNVARNFTYFTKVVNNIRKMIDVYARVRKKKDWGIDPEIQQLNPLFERWLQDLPEDLQIKYEADGSACLPTHFLGNLHSYYHLSIIMAHRPQLTFMKPSDPSGIWKKHMLICYSSAKQLCRLQESLLHSHGLSGLLCMQRGVNFTIYCILTCTILHLVALTSPDPDLNCEAREYFARHMRLLEKCSSSWPQPDMQEKIDALREAFSADIRKPFVLKPSFPYNSPRGPMRSPARVIANGHVSLDIPKPSANPYGAHPISPPISAGSSHGLVEPPSQMTGSFSTTPSYPHQVAHNQYLVNGDHQGEWNPSRILNQWASTFDASPPASTSSDRSTPMNTTPHHQTLDLPAAVSTVPMLPGQDHAHNLHMPLQQHAPPSMIMQQAMPAPTPQQAQLHQGQFFAGAGATAAGSAMPPALVATSSIVSPSMWQESVASVYEGGLKRSWGDYVAMTPGG